MNHLIKRSDISFPANFFYSTQDRFLKQHADFTTRFQEGKESPLFNFFLQMKSRAYIIKDLRCITHPTLNKVIM